MVFLEDSVLYLFLTKATLSCDEELETRNVSKGLVELTASQLHSMESMSL